MTSRKRKNNVAPTLRRQIYARVRAGVKERSLPVPTKAELDHAMTWPSVTSLFNQYGQVEDIDVDHIVQNILTYIRRNLQRREIEEALTERKNPITEKLDARHAVSYALAIAILHDEVWSTEIEQCRMHYWQQRAAPFPWLIEGGARRNPQALHDALNWLADQEKTGKGGDVNLEIRVAVNNVNDVHDIVLNVISTPGEFSGTPVASRLTPLVDELQKIGAMIPGDTPDIFQRWAGPIMRLKNDDFRVHPDGSLAHLHLLCHRLGKLPGWNTEKALMFMLCGDPPMPSTINLERWAGQRKPKGMRLDHTVLLQLVYVTPGLSWARRLAIWDDWFKRFPQAGLSLTFQNREHTKVTADTQRAKWLVSEYKRAFTRAMKLAPYSA